MRVPAGTVDGGLVGLMAALAMTLLLLVLRATFGLPTPSELVGDRLTAFISIKQFFALLDQFGGYSGLKQAGGGGVVVGQLVVGTAAGALVGSLSVRRVAPSWQLAAMVVAVLWIVTIAALWPNLGTNYRGLPPDAARLATGLQLLVSYSVYGVLLVLGLRALDPQSAAGATPSPGRRSLLIGASAVFATSAALLLRQFVQWSTFSYDGTEYRGDDVIPITPNDRFYTVTKNIVDPDPDPSIWRLEIGGLVDRARAYTFDQIRALPATTQETTLMCISNYVGGGLMSNAVWSGFPLRDILLAAGPRPSVSEVILYGADGYTDTYPLAKALEPTTFVAYAMNGEPLPLRHGYPVRILTPGLFGEKSVKWVTRIELVDRDVKGFYEQQGWGPSFVVPIRSTIYTTAFQTRFSPESTITVRGNAFAGSRGIATVELSDDNGLSWRPARIDYPGTDITWAFWTADWQPSGPGDYTLVARATDRTGQRQIETYRDTAPEGATGLASISVRVTA
jgi:DMSO/TMAO reductase YedYZ molybdopterin-dependent catalytic subunit